MKSIFETITNILRFIVYIPLCFTLLYVIYYLLYLLLTLGINMSVFWLIVSAFFLTSTIIGFGAVAFGFLAGILSYINPYKKLGKFIIIPIAIIYGILNIISVWKILDINQSKQLIIAIFSSALIFYLTIVFSIFISAKNPKEFISE